MKAGFARALRIADFPASGIASVMLGGWRILVARAGEEFRALNDRCTHAASPLSTGRLRHGAIMCPLHGARFDMASGRCVGGTYRAVRVFPLRLADGWIEIGLPDDPPGPGEAPLEG